MIIGVFTISKATKSNPHAKALGKLGGKVKSERKAAAARENGKLGGRPRKAAKQVTLSSATS